MLFSPALSLILSLALAASAVPAKKGGVDSNVASAASGAATSASSTATTAGGDEQASTTLDPKVIATGFANNGQDVQEAGQVPSLTSTNNFINFCLTQLNLPITNGKQIQGGSCNPAPMGVLPSSSNMPSSKFVFPTNGAVIQTGANFTISMAVNNLELGNFVNAQDNYFAAPQQVDSSGNIIGHTHFTIDSLPSLDSTTPTDPTKPAYFKGVNTAAVNGVVSVNLDKGLPAGFYRLASINAAANHQPVLVPIAQHGFLDDVVYFTVSDDGAASASNATIASSAAPTNAAASETVPASVSDATIASSAAPTNAAASETVSASASNATIVSSAAPTNAAASETIPASASDATIVSSAAPTNAAASETVPASAPDATIAPSAAPTNAAASETVPASAPDATIAPSAAPTNASTDSIAASATATAGNTATSVAAGSVNAKTGKAELGKNARK